MAEPGDPTSDQPRPSAEPEHHDDLVGFASPASLEGRLRATPEVEADPALTAAPPVEPEPEPDLFATPLAASQPAPAPGPSPMPEQASAPPSDLAGADPVFEPSREFSTRGRRREPPPVPGGGMGLYAVYALILFAVPTLGVSAIIALFAVTGRSGPEDSLSRGHFVYQQRTLWTAAVAALLGVILIVVNVGVFVLFALALWIVVRGAFGVWRLKAGQPIANPRGWLF
jgi:uncharacterized membrane protein